ncbi:aldehyde dehydrogenase family protein [Lichenihabitans psoromatis]|uniref:aldehyde dehydrogenase family protein n=1 Tax=Lichenihabitans psoromatis TaxID=2528642 RepID=UPI001036A56C|nr:aldehyde dehydrogenase family protein [Lichenihabitans psoromatis]
MSDDASIEVRSPYDGRIIGAVPRFDASLASLLVDQAQVGFATMKQLSRAERGAILDRAAKLVEADSTGYADLIVAEAGKPLKQARREVARCINTLGLSAEEARRNAGEVIPFDAFAGSERRQGWFSREPLGVIAAITPYNDPLNLVAHKVGPALAGGNSIILKPSERTPLSALRLLATLKAAGLPEDVLCVAVGDGALGQAIVSSRSVRMVTFTGGFRTGERIAASAGLKKLSMDLGGNAAVIVMADADIDTAVTACVSGAFWAAGQNCIGTQRILIQRPVYQRFRDAFVAETLKLKVGDPSEPDTDIGPLISQEHARSVLALIDEALAGGAALLAGGGLDGACLRPTVLEAAPRSCAAWREEIFAPVVLLDAFDDLDNAIAITNAPEYALHAGIFTENLSTAMLAADLIEAGGIMINDSSDYRFDAMPFGGYKYGSMGREGVRFAYEDMTQPKVVCINRSR